MVPKQHLTRQEASDYLTNVRGLPTSPKTLAKFATVGGGPEYRKFGSRRVVYEVSALDAWVESKLSRPFANTSQEFSNETN
jgi:hypothetical protein